MQRLPRVGDKVKGEGGHGWPVSVVAKRTK